MPRVSWPVALLSGLAATACVLKDNPGFDNTDTGTTTAATTSTTTGIPPTTATTTTDTAVPTTSGGSATGATNDVSSDPLLTTGDLTTTGATTSDITTGATTTDATTSDITTDTTTGDTTGPPPLATAELRHYDDLANCDFPFWCIQNSDINSPDSAENRAAECFDSPLEPPFMVSRVGFQVFGSKGGPNAVLEFHAYDLNAKKPVKVPFDARDIGLIDAPGYQDFEFPPVAVQAKRFCISVHSGEKDGPQLGVAVDHIMAPTGQTFVGMSGPDACKFETFTDIATVGNSIKTQWCIDATITKDP